MNLPQDPHILLSFINTKLRDEYPNLDELCMDFEIDYNHLMDVMSSIEYAYTMDKNRFVPKT